MQRDCEGTSKIDHRIELKKSKVHNMCYKNIWALVHLVLFTKVEIMQ